MIVLICPDKFKGSMDAKSLCNIISSELTILNPQLQCISMPMADGGDGTLEILNENLGLNSIIIKSIDPKGNAIYPRYLSDGNRAYIELAEASGMQHLRQDDLDVMHYHTVGTGKTIQHALKLNHKEIVLCLGGSCTNDMGMGIAEALGFSFLDNEGTALIPCGKNLIKIARIIAPIKKLSFKLSILADVKNPLYGPEGAAHVFAKQKGANDKNIIQLDNGMKSLALLIQKQFGKDISKLFGGGAAGGIAAGLFGLIENVHLESGVNYISNIIGLDAAIQNADLVITGEGRLDKQSFNGKVVGHVTERCAKYHIPVHAIVGSNVLSKAEQINAGITQIESVVNSAPSLQLAMDQTQVYLRSIIRSLHPMAH